MLAEGPAAEHLVAFVRGDDVLVAVTRHTVRLSEMGWGDTVLTLPQESGKTVSALPGISGRDSTADLFTELPVALLERIDD